VTYLFHPEAQSEHLETVAYYGTQQAGLGASYLSEYESVMARICEAPNRYPIEGQPDIRHTRLIQFPYTVLFRESNGTVRDLAVAHHRRWPLYWLNRL